ncbi:MAG: leucyl/phenylalanyl-tRNA--protein transferase [Spirochaetes bacterium]|nr:leucyl/phenylalanyl-tRNA--protein transferase [Spirochaetota bacterium]
MPIFALTEEIDFPPVELAEPGGVLAVGGDLSTERLIEAYTNGIFPWYSDDEPIIWWSPDPRFVLFPGELRLSRSMRKVLERRTFRMTCDADFRGVIEGCRGPRAREQGTWITDDMAEAYARLHDIGIAHSVEAWQGDMLAGGLYGISLGSIFFGESMFTRVANASKAAFITLTRRLEHIGFSLIDCQVYTNHLKSLGARDIPRKSYLSLLRKGLRDETRKGSWRGLLE